MKESECAKQELETHSPSNLWRSKHLTHVTAVISLMASFRFPHNTHGYKRQQIRLDVMRRPKHSFVPPTKEKTTSSNNINLPISVSVETLLLLHFITATCYGTLPILPSTDETSVVHLVQPLTATHLTVLSSIPFYFNFIVKLQQSVRTGQHFCITRRANNGAKGFSLLHTDCGKSLVQHRD